jgi:hypothetical protein
LRFAESLQIKLDKYSIPVNMNIVKLDRKKVLVHPSQSESTKDKGVIIGEKLPSRMIKLKGLKDGQ